MIGAIRAHPKSHNESPELVDGARFRVTGRLRPKW